MLDLYTVSVVIFFFIIGILLYKKRKSIDISHYVLFMWRTKRFGSMIDNIANISPRFWITFSTLGLIACIGFMLFGTFSLLTTANNIFTGLIKEPALKLILPYPTSDGADVPGVLFIPFWYWLIIIFSILAPHEFCHGIIARAQKIRLKSVGLFLFAIFPGAFVEPDEAQLKKAKLMKKLRVYGAGSFANLVIAFLIIILMNFVVWPLGTSQGIYLTNVTENSPAALAGLKPNTTITDVNGKIITTTYFESIGGKGYLIDEVGEPKAGDIMNMKADGKEYSVKLESNQETNKTYMGIIYRPVSKDSFLFGHLMQVLTMIWLFSFAVAIVNILPLYPLDGGLIVQAISERYFKKYSKKITRGISYIILLLILFGFFGPYLMAV